MRSVQPESNGAAQVELIAHVPVVSHSRKHQERVEKYYAMVVVCLIHLFCSISFDLFRCDTELARTEFRTMF